MWHGRLRTSVSPQSAPQQAEALRAQSAPPPETRVSSDQRNAAAILAGGILAHLAALGPEPRPVTVVCIGSDRSTGDALGPLVGTRLGERRLPRDVSILGSLERPVHAANLCEHLQWIENAPGDPIVLAVDACLGKSENVGTACVKPGPLRPGTGVNKSLPSIGHLHIVGVVNVGGFMEYFVLQNTRLNLVFRLAHVIADALELALVDYYGRRRRLAELAQLAAARE